MCRIDDGYRADAWRETHRNARKSHRCDDCFRTINARERYWYASGISDGEPFSYKMCMHCRVGAAWLVRNCENYMVGSVVEDIEEHSKGEFDLLRFCVAADRKWQNFAGTGLMPVPADMRDFAWPS